jgi:hypothetical protein
LFASIVQPASVPLYAVPVVAVFAIDGICRKNGGGVAERGDRLVQVYVQERKVRCPECQGTQGRHL